MSNFGAAAPTLFCSKCGSPTAANQQFCMNCGTPLPVASGLPYPVTRSVAYGGFWIRFVAAIIDFIVVGVACAPFMMMMAPLIISTVLKSGNRGPDPEQIMMLAGAGLKLKIVTQAIAWLYEALMTSSVRQATVGKIAVGLKVTDLYGQRLTFARATGRHFAKVLSALIMMIGFIMAGFTARKQALHDFIAGTLVVKA